MRNIRSMTLGEIVTKNYRASEIFEKFNLDYCCKGDRTLEDACLSSNIVLQEIIDALSAIDTKKAGDMNFDTWPLDNLADYIQKRHHKYIEDAIPVIKSNLDKICTIHGNRHPELFQLKEIFNEIAGDVTSHLKKEEFILFPYIKKMVKARETNSLVSSSLFGTVNSPVNLLKADHADEGVKLQRISELTNRYATPSDGCSTYQATYQYLKDFEQDMHRHIHLENNILFPKTISLEADLSSLAINSTHDSSHKKHNGSDIL